MSYKDREWLYDQYWNKNKTQKEIALMCDLKKAATISYWMKKFKIPRRTNSETSKGNKNGNWKGGRKFNSHYYFVLKPNHPYTDKYGYIAEHRLVMEKHLGRYLKRSEVVHHINYKKTDNRLENLYLFSKSIDHQKVKNSLYKLLPLLIDKKIIKFEEGEYLFV